MEVVDEGADSGLDEFGGEVIFFKEIGKKFNFFMEREPAGARCICPMEQSLHGVCLIFMGDKGGEIGSQPCVGGLTVGGCCEPSVSVSNSQVQIVECSVTFFFAGKFDIWMLAIHIVEKFFDLGFPFKTKKVVVDVTETYFGFGHIWVLFQQHLI